MPSSVERSVSSQGRHIQDAGRVSRCTATPDSAKDTSEFEVAQMTQLVKEDVALSTIISEAERVNN